MFKFLRAAFWLLLPLIVIDLAFSGVSLYLGLNPDDIVEWYQAVDGFAMATVKTMILHSTHFYRALGISPSWSRAFASFTALAFVLAACVPIVWGILRLWRYERWAYKQVGELWRNRKAAPSS